MTGAAVRTIIVGDDGSMRSRDAIEFAHDLGELIEADVRAEHLAERPARGLSWLARDAGAVFVVVGSTGAAGDCAHALDARARADSAAAGRAT